MNSTRGISQLLSTLTKDKRELLELLLKKEGMDISTYILPQERRQQGFPLTYAQTQLWFLSQLQPDSTAYHIPVAIRLLGILDTTALRKSLNAILQRHEALRTIIAVVDGEPVQLITPVSSLELPCIDLSDLAKAAQESAVIRLAIEQGEQPFDLAHDLLIRCALLKLNNTEHVLLFSLQHIISDTWSVGILLREMTLFYEAFRREQPVTLPDLPVQFVDFACWQRQWLTGATLEKLLSYWRRQLEEAPALLQLPLDHPRRTMQSMQGAREYITIPQRLVDALKVIGRQEGVSLFTTLLAAFKVLLYRYTGQEDILVGTPVAYRNWREIENVMGFFVNMLVIRTHVSRDLDFRALLKQVHQVAAEAYAHQDMPFGKLVEELQPERSLSYNPLFQVAFTFVNIPLPDLELSELSLSMVNIDNGTTKFDISLDLWEAEEGIQGWCEYSTDLFEAATISRMIKHFEVLLTNLAANCDQRLSELPILTEQERHQLVVEWNNNKAEYPHNTCIHKLFEAQAARIPENIAVVYGNEQLTYRDLDCQANQLAHYLQKLGVGPEVRVAICLERSLGLIVAVIATLKAGGAYVPLDPTYPQERLEFMLKDAGVMILITQKQFVARLSTVETQTIAVDTLYQSLCLERKDAPDSKVTAENLAYAIYTSGSTGRSKGAMITHTSLVNAYFAWEHAYELGSHSTCHLQMASFSFDVCTGDIVRSLCSGSKLILCPQELLLAPDKLYALMWREKVNIAEFVPVVLRNLLQYLHKTEHHLDFMYVLVVASDLWYWKEYQEIRELCGSETRVINSYGLTEATIDSSYFECTDGGHVRETLIPIGRPFTNTHMYVLDPHLQPVPIGISGELYIGGVGLARGYLNRPDQTAERFIPHPFSKQSGLRLYKTGDLARYLPDGNIELLGRTDSQVKLRGFRIELGEIESVLCQHPFVQNCAAIVREDRLGDKRLVAYVIPEYKARLTFGQLREFLKGRLPHYMIPSAFVLLETLPLLPNDKVDRQALPAPDPTQFTNPHVFTGPRNSIEETLISIWSKVIGVESIGIYDNFFELGGYSLLVVQIILQIRAVLHIDLSVCTLFEMLTIAELAKHIEITLRASDSKAATEESSM